MKSLEERLRQTESLLRAAGIVVEATEFDDVSDGSEDSVEHSDVLGGGSHSLAPPRSVPSRNTEESRSTEQASPASQIMQPSLDSEAPLKHAERGRSNAGKSGPPVYKPDKVSSLYIGMLTLAHYCPTAFGYRIGVVDCHY